nr:snurportin-1 [Ipomoea batatas]
MHCNKFRQPINMPIGYDNQIAKELCVVRYSTPRRSAPKRARRCFGGRLAGQTPRPPFNIHLSILDSETSCIHGVIVPYVGDSWIRPNRQREMVTKIGFWYVAYVLALNFCMLYSILGAEARRCTDWSILLLLVCPLENGVLLTNNKSAQSYCILDCVFHELDQTYYVTDMVCWAGFSLYECTAEFRFYWLNTKLAETGACDAPSTYHRYRFSSVPVYDCVQEGLQSAYTGPVPYVKDGLLFYNKQAHYQTGNTPLALVWKDTNCSQYVIDTDNKGEIPTQQQVVLELLDDGRLATSDDPPVIFGCLNGEFIQKSVNNLLRFSRFSVSEGGLVLVDGKLEKADLQYLGKPNRSRAFADSYSKVLFQYAVRHSPLQIEHIFASISSPVSDESASCDTEMAG